VPDARFRWAKHLHHQRALSMCLLPEKPSFLFVGNNFAWLETAARQYAFRMAKRRVIGLEVP
jgi:hypothetical protein